MYNDICGNSPSSSINYLCVAARIMFDYTKIDTELQRLKIPLFMEVSSSVVPYQLLDLLACAIARRDEGCFPSYGRGDPGLQGFVEGFRLLRGHRQSRGHAEQKLREKADRKAMHSYVRKIDVRMT
ncbi:hypothetical protein LY78DRAFT_194905 [Colletotrichum sublineola]|nr:hypothetical protein LY78DRAFT_194905 [Colletotrichum sublineola]